MVLSGGVTHDFAATSAQLVELLGDVGVGATVREDVEAVLADIDDIDLLVVNMLRWRMLTGRYAKCAGRFGVAIDPALQAAVEAWVHAGGAVVALHAASICFDDWNGWRDLVGASWNWSRSHHPPLGYVEVTVHRDLHPVVAGLPTSFTVVDEAYGFLDYADDVVPLATASHTGAVHPLLWARTVGRGRVVHDTLGHHVASFEPEVHRRIVRRSALWALGRPDAEVVAV